MTNEEKKINELEKKVEDLKKQNLKLANDATFLCETVDSTTDLAIGEHLDRIVAERERNYYKSFGVFMFLTILGEHFISKHYEGIKNFVKKVIE